MLLVSLYTMFNQLQHKVCLISNGLYDTIICEETELGFNFYYYCLNPRITEVGGPPPAFFQRHFFLADFPETLPYSSR